LSELRKKTTLYSIIEQDGNGNFTLRIEEENYSYGSKVLLDIPELPLQYRETMDDNNIYNEIKVVYVSYITEWNGINNTGEELEGVIVASNAKFTLLSDDASCENLEDIDDNFRPFLGEFEYPICYADYKKMQQDKKGIIRVNNQDTWIKEIKFNPKGLSNFIVKYKNSMC
jgi:hypothetical protein